MSRRRSASAANLIESAAIFAALGDSMRLAVVSRLCNDGPQSITRLSDGVTVTRQAVTKHLHALAGAGLVRNHRRGREQVWELEPHGLEVARRSLDRISQQWNAAIERLKTFVEE